MTLESTINKNRYIGNGATTQFPFTFKIWKTDQILVYVGDGETEQEVSAQCTVNITPSGGTVSFPTAPASGAIIVIRRNMPYIQEDDYRNGARFNGEEVEDRFDQDCAERQDLLSDIGRCIKMPETSSETSEEFAQTLLDALAAMREAGDVTGSSLVKADGSTEYRALASRFADVINAKDFGAKGDGATNDSIAFASLEAAVSGKCIDLCGLSYKVAAIPCGNFYYNGSFVVGDRTTKAYGAGVLAYWMPDELPGFGVGNADVNFFISDGVTTPDKIEAARAASTPRIKDVVLIGNRAGYGATKNGTYLADVVAIGSGIMSYNNMTSAAQHNIGIGQFALHRVTSGDRNIGIGSLSLVGLTSGSKNIAIGRDCCQGITTGSKNTAVGYRAMGEYGWSDFDGEIDGLTRISGDENVAIGNEAGFRLAKDSNQNVYVGSMSGGENKKAYNNTVAGRSAFASGQINTSINGKVVIKETLSGTYSQTGTTVTVVMPGHHAVAGCYVVLDLVSSSTDGYNASFLVYVDSVSGDTFTIVSPVSNEDSGTCTSQLFEQSTDSTELAEGVCAFGHFAMAFLCGAQQSVAVGVNALRGNSNSTGTTQYSIAIGSESLKLQTYSNRAVSIGYCSSQTVDQIETSVIIGDYSASGADTKITNTVSIGSNAGRFNPNNHIGNVLVGSSAGNRKGNLTNCVFIGRDAMYSDSDTTAFTNSIAIGYQAAVTGNNQFQLGNSSVTTYAYGSVQDRSDARDKTDIRDSILGLDFLLSLRPVDFRWDYRDDYVDYVEKEIEIVDDEGVTTTETVMEAVPVEKDGSRKRVRYHHGLIAQEVKAVLDEKGIDFGGYQDHKVNGGKDVLTLGYEEFIAPIIKSLQEIDARLKALEA